MTSRYFTRKVLMNEDKQYSKILKKRNVTFINQYDSPNFPFITTDDILSVTPVPHIWKLGDRLYKLADEYYQDPTLWWMIAWYNRLPTESHIKIGWIVEIPLPIERMLELWDKPSG